MKSNLFIIAQSGLNYVAFAAITFLSLLLFNFGVLAFLAFLITLFFFYIFRNPERELLSFDEGSILSPVDGVVVAIEEIQNDEYAYRVDIKSSYLDVALLRVPMNAEVESLSLQNGTRVSSESKLFSHTNENAEIVFVDKNKNRVKVHHTLTQSIAPLSIDIIKSQNLLKSARYGVMLCGVTSIYLPKNVRVNVNLANEVKASETLIANLS